jgi:hypothetical protein
LKGQQQVDGAEPQEPRGHLAFERHVRERDVEGPAIERQDVVGSRVQVDLQIYVPEACACCRQDPVDDGTVPEGAAAEHQDGLPKTVGLANTFLHPVSQLDDEPGLFEEDLSLGGELDRACISIDEAYVERALQRLDRLGQARLRSSGAGRHARSSAPRRGRRSTAAA